eukprot:comp22717_c1_seq1/m.35282 comp22717_c1_seq1/g.35282  ORF comp22717_c1_seq1/g.35282 comp22717_c1_seq1/m.35282 type:complete len:131 (-) comp22717_c1_seq1:1468-1860(-)
MGLLYGWQLRHVVGIRCTRGVLRCPALRLGVTRKLHTQNPPSETDSTNNGPLAGIRILDMTRVLAGPYCTMMLGDLGAEVIKVERPDGGDDTRAWKPPDIHGESAYFLCVNRNKKSIAVDFKSQKGQGRK